jgi:soluble lytic murein transglycosylase-like protein
MWRPALGNSTFRRVVLPAAVTGFVLASIAVAQVTFTGGDAESASAGPPPSGDVAAWIAQAEQVLADNGWTATARDTADIALIVQGESGGNPRAINTTDSNAVAGHPSKGLMQTIDSTFAAHAVSGHGDIWNPVDNIVAGVRYAISRYGSLDNVPGVAAVHAGGSYIGY